MAVTLGVAAAAAVGVAGLPRGATPSVQAVAQLQAPSTWTSGFQVQNLGSGTATVRITYYNQDGSEAGRQTDTIAPGASKTFFDRTMAVPDGFYGSVVIESDQPVAAITNELAFGPNMAGSYDGVIHPAQTFYLPLIQRGNVGWNSEIFIQNAGEADASDVRVEFFRGADRVATKQIPALKRGAAFTLRQADQAELGDRFVGSATVRSSQPVAAVVNQSNGAILLTYSGFASGSNRVFAPLIMTDNRGWSTGMQVQNVGQAEVTVTLSVNGQAVDSAAIAAGASKSWFPVPGTSPGFVGSAMVEGPAGSQLVGIVNELNPALGQGMSYNGFNSGTAKVYAPLLMNKVGQEGWDTGFQVQNVGASATTVTFKIGDQVADTTSIAPGQSKTWYPIPGTSPRFVGSGTVEGPPGSQLVGIVNQIQTTATSAGDNSMAYEAFNQ
ncbi:MAG: hypothetical protein HY691_20385 [Chloroflexi bacterium]|nr:hypothetical protein [Chloroflexota bacterium]